MKKEKQAKIPLDGQMSQEPLERLTSSDITTFRTSTGFSFIFSDADSLLCCKIQSFSCNSFFSLFFDIALHGGTAVRPVFFEFTSDLETHDLGEQFMWGGVMLIIPVYQEVGSNFY